MRCTASIVASVPELEKRHSGRPKRRASSSATAIASSVGWAKWVPLGTLRVVDPRALSVADPDHLRTGDLPARGRPSSQNPPRLPDQSPRPGLTFLEPAFTLDDYLVEPAEVPIGPTPHSLHILLL